MIRSAFWAGAFVAAFVFVRLTSVQMRAPDCVPLPDHPGAVVCGAVPARVGVALAAPLEGAATVETILADALATPLPTPNMRAPLPTWLPAGVLGHEAEIRSAAAEAGLDPLALAILVAIECPSGNAGCTSYVGARGIAQIMPATASSLEQQTGFPCTSQAHDPLTSLRCGSAYYLQGLRAAAPLWALGREADAIGAAGIGYNGGNGLVPRVVAHVQAGGAVCEAPVPAESRRWCSMATDMWRKAGRQ